jgi:acylphosphatase
MIVCKRVHYSGRVQGVGFRYTTQGVAQGFAVAGYVKNLPDGDVELLAEGEPAVVEAFLAAVGQRMGRYIEETRAEDLPPSGVQGFRIRH